MIKSAAMIATLLAISLIASGQDDSTKHAEKRRYNFSGLPIVAYDADFGFQYGVIANMFDYGESVVIHPTISNPIC